MTALTPPRFAALSPTQAPSTNGPCSATSPLAEAPAAATSPLAEAPAAARRKLVLSLSKDAPVSRERSGGGNILRGPGSPRGPQDGRERASSTGADRRTILQMSEGAGYCRSRREGGRRKERCNGQRGARKWRRKGLI